IRPWPSRPAETTYILVLIFHCPTTCYTAARLRALNGSRLDKNTSIRVAPFSSSFAGSPFITRQGFFYRR
ncbi:MAG: hypothetical protein WBO11_13785, partial [Nitrospira sp.]